MTENLENIVECSCKYMGMYFGFVRKGERKRKREKNESKKGRERGGRRERK